MKFIYSSGQRVLDGYTLKRGIGQGGFGEVYYAVSDGGKEVALKLVRGQNLDTEIRGMAQCLNLKHPNLLTLYDLRNDADGDHWVVMEYISGEALSGVLNRYPTGLSAELTKKWFVQLGEAIAYLHEHGIVHRDLKPGNIFTENGVVKVGDYGLSKFISCSQRSAQTQSVGTVHYMAPEISTGNYNKSIDIYASGIILYEMLTGRVPFEGESAGEILMKHLTSPPDLSKLPKDFVPLVGKALAKNPAHRFMTMAEMTKAVETVGAASGGRQSPVERQSPVAAPPLVNGNGHAKPQADAKPQAEEPILTALPAPCLGKLLSELCGSLAGSAALSALFMALFAALGNNLGKHHTLTDIGAGFFLTVGVCWAVLIPAKLWNAKMRTDSWTPRLFMMVFGALIGLEALWLDGWVPQMAGGMEAPKVSSLKGVVGPDSFWEAHAKQTGLAAASACLSYFALAFFAVRWWKMADPRRWQRFSFAPVLAAAFWGLVLLLVWPQPWRGTVVLMTAAAVIQLVSPWYPPPPPSAKRLRLRYS